jgi:hypothetical protein
MRYDLVISKLRHTGYATQVCASGKLIWKVPMPEKLKHHQTLIHTRKKGIMYAYRQDAIIDDHNPLRTRKTHLFGEHAVVYY